MTRATVSAEVILKVASASPQLRISIAQCQVSGMVGEEVATSTHANLLDVCEKCLMGEKKELGREVEIDR